MDTLLYLHRILIYALFVGAVMLYSPKTYTQLAIMKSKYEIQISSKITSFYQQRETVIDYNKKL